MRRRPVRQWIVLTSLVAGLATAAIGASIGQPNSWGWFSLGAGLVLLIGATSALGGMRRASRIRK
ncbi:MAG: hypothetical protein JWP32_690 [Schumannella sp.]|jgi:hypothetical protein|nr:hypothetical protein [Schumannella sp.]